VFLARRLEPRRADIGAARRPCGAWTRTAARRGAPALHGQSRSDTYAEVVGAPAARRHPASSRCRNPAARRNPDAEPWRRCRRGSGRPGHGDTAAVFRHHRAGASGPRNGLRDLSRARGSRCWTTIKGGVGAAIGPDQRRLCRPPRRARHRGGAPRRRHGARPHPRRRGAGAGSRPRSGRCSVSRSPPPGQSRSPC